MIILLDDYSLVDNNDFSNASERKIYIGCREESGDHNDDKKKELFKIKFYSKEVNLRVLQLYDIIGVFYGPDIIHVITCQGFAFNVYMFQSNFEH